MAQAGNLALSHLLKIGAIFDNLWQMIKGSDVKNRSKNMVLKSS
jgi:hypothetical protein